MFLDDTHFFSVCAVLCWRSGSWWAPCCKISFILNGSSSGNSSSTLLLTDCSGETSWLLKKGPCMYYKSKLSALDALLPRCAPHSIPFLQPLPSLLGTSPWPSRFLSSKGSSFASIICFLNPLHIRITSSASVVFQINILL